MRNKYKLTAGLVVLALAGTVAASLAFADDSASTDTSTTTTSNTTNTTHTNLAGKIDAVRQKLRQAKAQAINKLAENQLNRAQTAFDRLSNVLTRLEALRAKINISTTTTTSTGTDNSSANTSTSTNTNASTNATVNTAAIDALITKAEAQKTSTQKDMDDLKAKIDALKTALTTAAANTSTSTTVAPTHRVQDFMNSIKTLKNDLTAWHKTLQQIVADMKSMNGQDRNDNQNDNNQDQSTTTTTNTSTSTTTTTNAGGENQ